MSVDSNSQLGRLLQAVHLVVLRLSHDGRLVCRVSCAYVLVHPLSHRGARPSRALKVILLHEQGTRLVRRLILIPVTHSLRLLLVAIHGLAVDLGGSGRRWWLDLQGALIRRVCLEWTNFQYFLNEHLWPFDILTPWCLQNCLIVAVAVI